MSTVRTQAPPSSTWTRSHVLIIVAIAFASFLIGLSFSSSTVGKATPAASITAPRNGSPTTWTSASRNDSTNTTANATENAHIYFLLDRSGSMQQVASDVIAGFNSFVEEQKLAASSEAKLTMTLIQFDSQNAHEVVFSGREIGDVPPLTAETFVPRAMTPLYDALGRTISTAATAHTSDERIVLVTFSDGKENASREHSRKSIFALIGDKQDAGWTFVFLGANQDSYAQGGGLGFSASNTQNFAFDQTGVEKAYKSISTAMFSMRRKLNSVGSSVPEAMYDSRDFFEGEKIAEADFSARTKSSSSFR